MPQMWRATSQGTAAAAAAAAAALVVLGGDAERLLVLLDELLRGRGLDPLLAEGLAAGAADEEAAGEDTVEGDGRRAGEEVAVLGHDGGEVGEGGGGVHGGKGEGRDLCGEEGGEVGRVIGV
jgi:hypothetical protein